MIGEVLLAEAAWEEMEAESGRYPDLETGGLWPGVIIERTAVIPFTIPPGPDAVHESGFYQPDVAAQQLWLDQYFLRFRADYRGSWHKHPAYLRTPSHHDFATARHITSDPSWHCPEALFPIVTHYEGRLDMRVFAMRRDDPRFIEVPHRLVPDTHPFMRRVLLGEFRPTAAKESSDVPVVELGCPAHPARRSRARRWLGRLWPGPRSRAAAAGTDR